MPTSRITAPVHIINDPNPQDEAALQDLLKVAVDPEGTYVTVIGLGLRPWNIFSEEVAFPMAKRGARVDAQNWLALIRKALGKGYIESGIPLRAQVYGARILLEQVISRSQSFQNLVLGSIGQSQHDRLGDELAACRTLNHVCWRWTLR